MKPENREKLALVVLLLTVWAGGYYAIGLTTDLRAARRLGTPLDAAIPRPLKAIHNVRLA